MRSGGSSVLVGLLAVVLGACLLDRAGRGESSPADGGAGGGGTDAVVVGGMGGDSGGMGGVGLIGGGGTGGAEPVCGDGVVAATEGCDDNNGVPADGCTECFVDDEYTCAGMPSRCVTVEQELVAAEGLPVAITDKANHYNGTMATMDCVAIEHSGLAESEVGNVQVQIGIDHNFVGDLIIKVQSPLLTVVTLVNRPGANEPADSYSESPNGDGSNLRPTSPITFDDAFTDDAETMGDTILTGGVICASDNRCNYLPNPTTATGMGLSDFVGESPVGTWRVCAADGDDLDAGTIENARVVVSAAVPR